MAKTKLYPVKETPEKPLKGKGKEEKVTEPTPPEVITIEQARDRLKGTYWDTDKVCRITSADAVMYAAEIVGDLVESAAFAVETLDREPFKSAAALLTQEFGRFLPSPNADSGKVYLPKSTAEGTENSASDVSEEAIHEGTAP